MDIPDKILVCYILTVPRTKIMMLFYLRGLAEDIMNTLHVEFLAYGHNNRYRFALVPHQSTVYSNIPRYPSKRDRTALNFGPPKRL